MELNIFLDGLEVQGWSSTIIAGEVSALKVHNTQHTGQMKTEKAIKIQPLCCVLCHFKGDIKSQFKTRSIECISF